MGRAVVAVIVFVVLMSVVRRSTRCVHVRRIEHHRIEGPTFVGQLPAVNPGSDVGIVQLVALTVEALPEHAFAECDISDS